MADTVFGINLARIISDSFAGQLPTGILYKNSQEYTFTGVLEVKTIRRPETAIARTMSTITILGGSLPVIPEVNDTILFEDKNWDLVELLNRDPANASYTFMLDERFI